MSDAALSPSMSEWRRGWRVVLGAAIGSGLGVPLFFHTLSLFNTGMMESFDLSRGEMANLQALIVLGALFAPLIGRALDRFGFRWVYSVATLGVVVAHLLMATTIDTILGFAVMVFAYGLLGIGCGPLVYTRPINTWFWHSRGLALGLAAVGLTLTAAIAPPLLANLIEAQGWRAGYAALAALTGLIALPLAILLVRDEPPEGPAGPPREAGVVGDRSHFRETDFWLLAGAMFAVSIPGAGLLNQLSPLVQEEGIGPAIAAFGVTGYALGQLTGRIVAGWFLDRVDPRKVAFFFTAVPALGFVFLAGLELPVWAAILCVAMVGVQQGAEIDLFAFFTARRFGLHRYGTVYGWLITALWVGNAVGISSFGTLHDLTGSFRLAETIAAALMIVGGILISRVRIPRTA